MLPAVTDMFPYCNTQGRMLTQQMVCGRLVCDVKISSKELIRARSYDLTGGCCGRHCVVCECVHVRWSVVSVWSSSVRTGEAGFTC